MNFILFKKAFLSISSNSSSLIESVIANVPALNIMFNNDDKDFYKEYKKYILNFKFSMFLKIKNFRNINKIPFIRQSNKNTWDKLININ